MVPQVYLLLLRRPTRRSQMSSPNHATLDPMDDSLLICSYTQVILLPKVNVPQRHRPTTHPATRPLSLKISTKTGTTNHPVLLSAPTGTFLEDVLLLEVLPFEPFCRGCRTVCFPFRNSEGFSLFATGLCSVSRSLASTDCPLRTRHPRA